MAAIIAISIVALLVWLLLFIRHRLITNELTDSVMLAHAHVANLLFSKYSLSFNVNFAALLTQTVVAIIFQDKLTSVCKDFLKTNNKLVQEVISSLHQNDEQCMLITTTLNICIDRNLFSFQQKKAIVYRHIHMLRSNNIYQQDCPKLKSRQYINLVHNL